MSEIKFGYNEAIGHGWAMTKKYFKTILLFILIYIAFGIPGEVLQHFAGGKLSINDFKSEAKPVSDAKQLYESLVTAGYIDRSENVHLNNITSADQLTLPDWAQPDRQTIYNTLYKHSYRLPFAAPFFILLCILLWFIQTLISIGVVKISLMLARDEQPTINDLFSNLSVFIPYVLASICYGLAVVGGMILLIVPGIILMMMFSAYTFLVVDKKLGAIEALKRSRVITKGSRGRIAVFGLYLLLINILGLVCLIVGVFVTASISSIASAYVYTKLEEAQEREESVRPRLI